MQMERTLLQIAYSLNSIDEAARQFWEVAHGCSIFAFSGEMGAGKTTFIHKLCDLLQVQDTVSSPTFALINEYHFADAGENQVIFHLDWYRLKDAAEAINAGMEDCLLSARNGEARCFIEWPEKALELLQPPYLWISIATTDIDNRLMTVTLING